MINDEQINGYWYLPSKSDDHFYGQLTFGPLASPRLSLTATPANDLSGFPFDVGDYVIWGYDSKTGESITLFGCNRLDIGFGGSVVQSSMFNAQRILFGRHVMSEDSKEFDEVRFSFENFEDWINVFGHEINIRSARSYTVSYECQPDISFDINDNISGGLTFWNNLPQIKKREIVLLQDSLIKLDFKNTVSLDEILSHVWKLQQFITLLMFEQTKVKWIFIGTKEKELRLFYRQKNPDAGKDSRTLYLLPFRLVQPLWGTAIMKWFDLAEELSPIINILHANIGENAEFVHNNFLNIVQAVEAFHRRIIQSTTQLKSNNQQIVLRILENIKNPEDRKWLEGKLAYSYEPNLRVRLKELIAQHHSVLFVTAPAKKNIGRLITDIVDKRNYFTHYDPSLEKDKEETVKILNYTHFLKTLLAFCLLSKVGFDSDYLKENIYNRFRFRL